MKNPHHSILVCLLLITAASTPAIAQKSGRDRVLKIDAVALIDHGKEVEGKVEFQQQHGRYLYLFANEANLNTFKANAAKYEIQLGGACGRMGPLSGEGSPKIFAVHEGLLYIFASEQCKRTFVVAPQKFIERDDPQPAVTEESQRRGRVIIDNVRAHSGMMRKSREIKTLRERLTRSEESGGKTYTVTDTVTLMLPDGVRQDICWNEDCWSLMVRGDHGWTIDSRGAEPMADAQRQALLRDAGRHPLMLISQRDKPGFIATRDGERRTLSIDGEGEVDCAIVVIYWAGAATTIGVDATGRVRLVAYRGRGPDLTIGDVEKVYSAFHDVDGRELRGRVQATFNGKPAPTLSGVYPEQVANDPADTARFEQPRDVAK